MFRGIPKMKDDITLQLNRYNFKFSDPNHIEIFMQVLLALKEIVSREKLFDRRNPTLIICNSELEDALEMKALHITEIK